MTPLSITAVLLVLTAVAYVASGKHMVRALARDPMRTQGAVVYHKWYVALSCAVPALLILAIWSLGEPAMLKRLAAPHIHGAESDVEREMLLANVSMLAERAIETKRAAHVENAADPRIREAIAVYRNFKSDSRTALTIIVAALFAIGGIFAFKRIHPRFNARRRVEVFMKALLLLSSTIAIMTTIGIVLSVLFESMRFFGMVSVLEFLFGTAWVPQAEPGSYGSVPLFTGTLLISFIAMLVATPIGLMSALYLSEYASDAVRATVKPLLEVLAGVPTVVYGFFAALTVAPAIRQAGESLGLSVSSESALAAGLTMGIMLIPFISSLSDDVINAVPQAMRDGSFGLGATRSETIVRVIVPAALPGIVGGVLLAISRAIGETMIVVMAAGFSARLTANPFESVTTVTVQIVTLLVGDQEFDSPKTLAAFALGLTLFFATLTLNVIALRTVRKYREKYE